MKARLPALVTSVPRATDGNEPAEQACQTRLVVGAFSSERIEHPGALDLPGTRGRGRIERPEAGGQPANRLSAAMHRKGAGRKGCGV